MELLPEDSPLRPAVVAEAVQHLWQCGRSTAAQHLAATTLDRALSQDPAAIVPVRLRLATIFAAYSTAAADAQCRAALEHPSVPDDLRHQVLVFQAVNFGLGGDPEAGDEVLDLARRVEPASLDPQVELDLMRARAYIAFHRRQWAHAAQLHQDVIDASPDEHWLLLTGFWEMATSMSVGDTERALAMAEAEMAASRRAGRMGTLLISAQMRTRALYDAGRLEEAREQAGDVLEIDEAPPVGGLSGLLLYYALVRAALHEGRPDVLRAQREAVELMIGDASHRIRRNGLWLRALILDAAGDVEGALRAAAENIAMLGQPGPALSGLPDLEDEVILTRMALRAGERETAERAVAAAERRSADNPTYPMAAASARHARGLLDRDTAALREAVQLLGAGPRPLLLASAQEDLARQVAADRPREAIALLDEALRTCIEAGRSTTPLASAGGCGTSAYGVGGARPDPGRPGAAGGADAREQEVVRLVVEGCTNRQVAERRHLSPHTVNTHLRNAFMKLGGALPHRARPSRRRGDPLVTSTWIEPGPTRPPESMRLSRHIQRQLLCVLPEDCADEQMARSLLVAAQDLSQSGSISPRSSRARPTPSGTSSHSVAALAACAQS
jgi:DNA-binding CsgD family transcriptional regulator